MVRRAALTLQEALVWVRRRAPARDRGAFEDAQPEPFAGRLRGAPPGRRKGFVLQVALWVTWMSSLPAFWVLPLGQAQDPLLVGQWPPAPRLHLSAVVGSGQYAYALGGSDGAGVILQVLDLADPVHPVPVSAQRLAGVVATGGALVLRDRWLLAVGCVPPFMSIDLSDPVHPTVAAASSHPRILSAYGATIVGDCMYVAAGGRSAAGGSESGLQIIDVSDPVSPALLGGIESKGSYSSGTMGVAVNGHYAYLADGEGGFQVIDIQDPANPTRVGEAATGVASNVAVNDTHAFVAVSELGVVIVDIRDPSRPLTVGSYLLPGAHYVVLVSNVLFASTGFRLEAVDVTDPINPRRLGTCEGVKGALHPSSLWGSYILVASDEGLRVVDVKDPGDLKQVSRYGGLKITRAAAVSGDYALLASGRTLEVVDVSKPWEPVLTTEVALEGSGSFTRLLLAGPTAYLFSRFGAGLSLVDVSQPEHPVPASYTPGAFGDLTIVGRYALAGHLLGMNIYDVSNAYKPVLVATNAIRSFRVASAGQYGLVAGGILGPSFVLDLANPTNPVPVAQLEMKARYVAMLGRYGYAANSPHLEIVDLQDPARPAVLGGYDIRGSSVMDMAVSGHYLFVCGFDGGLEVVDVSDPTNPIQVALFDRATAESVAISGNRVFLANGVWGLAVLDCSELLGRSSRLLPPIATPGGWEIQFSGDAGLSYQLLRSDKVSGPWSPLGTVLTTDGIGVYHDDSAPASNAFYRVVGP